MVGYPGLRPIRREVVVCVTGRAVLRPLLLLVVSAGVAGMHTLGHATSSGHVGVAGHSAEIVADEPIMAAAGIAMEAVAPHTDASGIDTRLHPLTVCLAILAGSLLLLLAAMLAACTRRQ